MRLVERAGCRPITISIRYKLTIVRTGVIDLRTLQVYQTLAHHTLFLPQGGSDTFWHYAARLPSLTRGQLSIFIVPPHCSMGRRTYFGNGSRINWIIPVSVQRLAPMFRCSVDGPPRLLKALPISFGVCPGAH